MLWLSGVAVDWTFTSGGLDIRTHLFIDHRHVKFFVCVLISQSQNNFISEIFPIYSKPGFIMSSLFLKPGAYEPPPREGVFN